MNPFDDYALINPCTHCGAQPHHRCATTCAKPHGVDTGNTYVIRCDVGDHWDTNTETRTSA